MSSQETVVVTQWTVGSGRQTYTILGDHQSMQSRRGRPVFDHYRKPGSQIINLRVIPHPFGLILIRRTNSRSKTTKQEDKSEALSGLIWTHLPASSRYSSVSSALQPSSLSVSVILYRALPVHIVQCHRHPQGSIRRPPRRNRRKSGSQDS